MSQQSCDYNPPRKYRKILPSTECVLIAVLKLFVPIFGSFVIVDDFLETSSFDCLVTGTIVDLAHQNNHIVHHQKVLWNVVQKRQ
jgi:hypothetical protein